MVPCGGGLTAAAAGCAAGRHAGVGGMAVGADAAISNQHCRIVQLIEPR